MTKVKVPGIENIELPKMAKIRQVIPNDYIKNVPLVIKEEMDKINLEDKIIRKKNVAITVGSRGIDRIAEIIKSVVDEVKLLGARPFIISAMGSHGGGTAQGQKEILESYGVTEESMGVPIVSSMEVVKIGETEDGVPVYLDKNAMLADSIIIINRVKAHTDFDGEIESGLMKMMAIGLGKHKGASVIHGYGFERFCEIIPKVGLKILEKAPICFGIALVENGHNKLCEIKAIEPKDIYKTEKELLKKQKQLKPEIPFEDIDILIVNEIGKDISGSGMDTNIIGRAKGIDKNIKIIIPLDLTDKTYGNACGIGLGDLTVERLFNKIDFNVTYTNALTSSGNPRGVCLPVVLKNDEYAIKVAMKLLNKNGKDVKLVRIQNTLSIIEMEISEKLFYEVHSNKNNKNIEILGGLVEFKTDRDGNLLKYPYKV